MVECITAAKVTNRRNSRNNRTRLKMKNKSCKKKTKIIVKEFWRASHNLDREYFRSFLFFIMFCWCACNWSCSWWRAADHAAAVIAAIIISIQFKVIGASRTRAKPTKPIFWTDRTEPGSSVHLQFGSVRSHIIGKAAQRGNTRIESRPPARPQQ